MTTVLNAYEHRYGQAVREYAETALPQWRSGKREMSGLVAERLFSLLPAFMPLARKYDLVKSLWEAMCPRSHKTFCLGANADSREIIASVKRHLEEVVQNYAIPESIAKRFRWLAQDDVRLQQELHNYFLQLNREVLSVATGDRIPRLLATVRAEGVVQRISQSIRIGNHQLDLVFVPAASGVSAEKPKAGMAPNESGCLVIIIIFVILFTGAIARAMSSEWSRAPVERKTNAVDVFQSRIEVLEAANPLPRVVFQGRYVKSLQRGEAHSYGRAVLQACNPKTEGAICGGHEFCDQGYRTWHPRTIREPHSLGFKRSRRIRSWTTGASSHCQRSYGLRQGCHSDVALIECPKKIN